MSFESWVAFCGIALLATTTPGPAALLVSVNSLAHGFLKSLFTVLGNASGLFIMSGCSVAGLSALVAHSAVAFTMLKMIGAFYLIYLGIKYWQTGLGSFKTPGEPAKTGENRTESHVVEATKSGFNLYLQGVVIALTNPKAIVFTTALFPQFIAPSAPLLPQFSLLVISFMALSCLCLSGYALIAHTTKDKSQNIIANKVSGKIAGATFFGAGCYLATSSQ